MALSPASRGKVDRAQRCQENSQYKEQSRMGSGTAFYMRHKNSSWHGLSLHQLVEWLPGQLIVPHFQVSWLLRRRGRAWQCRAPYSKNAEPNPIRTNRSHRCEHAARIQLWALAPQPFQTIRDGIIYGA